MKLEDLKAGTYRLTRDVENPGADRRHKNDWRMAPVWKAGAEFVVTQHKRDVEAAVGAALTPEQRAALEARLTYYTIVAVGNRWHHTIGPGNEDQYTALVEALEPCPESHEAMFTRLGVRSHFWRWFVESGRLTPELFEKLWLAYEEANPDKPYEQGAPLVEALAQVELVFPRPPQARLAIQYDDRPDDVVRRVNGLLAKVGWAFVETDAVLDGVIEYKLERVR